MEEDETVDREGILFAALSTLGFGLFPILAKRGLVGVSPFIGGVNSIAAGLFMFLILMLFSGKFRNFTQDRSRSIAFFFAVGVSNTLAIALFYKALQLNLASVVVPLTSTYPLATLLLSHFLLREGERLNRAILIGALFIIGGTILILCSR